MNLEKVIAYTYYTKGQYRCDYFTENLHKIIGESKEGKKVITCISLWKCPTFT